ncbi:GNAT family N-acetyltransferase [Paraburkholderia kururiensis]|uniref:GNAT family N-acetyltransferase n=1 Tax=Paraburkholderia kururiensis TaxID=984307 RepID=UPI0005A9EDD8|nr:GNAT family N-acetyltransferase [Paraburkholderia kururiensis]
MAEQPSIPEFAHVEWRWKAFDDLTTVEVYDMLAARAAVFVMEQNCLYGDIDGLDTTAWHLFAYSAEAGEADGTVKGTAKGGRPELAGYLRVLLPDASDPDIRIGRVLTTAPFRGIKLGNAMLDRALFHIRVQWPGVPIRLHAQAHLQKFYGAFGFEAISGIHEEDGIAHVWMRSAA